MTDVTLLPARPPFEGEFGPVPALDEIRVGDLVVAYSRGAERVAMVEKIGRTNVGVVYTTKGAWDEAQRIVDIYRTTDVNAQVLAESRQAAKNYDYYVQESDATTAVHAVASSWRSEENAEAERAKIRGLLSDAGTREEYVAGECEKVRQGLAERKAKALNGPAQFVHVTRKSVKHADLIGYAEASR